MGKNLTVLLKKLSKPLKVRRQYICLGKQQRLCGYFYLVRNTPIDLASLNHLSKISNLLCKEINFILTISTVLRAEKIKLFSVFQMQNLMSFKHLCKLLKYKNEKHNQKVVFLLCLSPPPTPHTLSPSNLKQTNFSSSKGYLDI